MAFVQDRLVAASQRHASLLSQLRSVEYAPSELAQTDRFIARLEKQIEQAKADLAEAQKNAQAEQADHDSMRDSNVRRFLYKSVGKRTKFEAKASKEEYEYVLARQHETDVMAQLELLQSQLVSAREMHGVLATAATECKQLQTDLDTLYENIFAGPTPGFPQEDQLEWQVNTVRNTYDEANARCTTQARAVELLLEARKIMGAAKDLFDGLNSMASMDIIKSSDGVGFAKVMTLAQLKTSLSGLDAVMQQAIELDPLVERLPAINLPGKVSTMDLYHDNVFSDVKFVQKLEVATQEVFVTWAALKQQTLLAREREALLRSETAAKKVVLDDARQALQQAREDVFRSLEMPPQYV